MIDKFTDQHAFLSNFYPAPVRGYEDTDVEYPTVEHAYQAAKTLSEGERMMIRACSTPGKAKRMGQRITIRPDWLKRRNGVMLALVGKKFHPGSQLWDKLVATGIEELVEGNNWGDTYWGICNGVGQNVLGRQLMYLRDRDWSNGVQDG
jgi:ribA/ribD-fused uncharacterized protein